MLCDFPADKHKVAPLVEARVEVQEDVREEEDGDGRFDVLDGSGVDFGEGKQQRDH